MTHPLIAIAGIFLVGAMYGATSPGAHADVVSCKLEFNMLMPKPGTKNGKIKYFSAGVMNIDTVAKTVTTCGENGCRPPDEINITVTRKGFNFSDATPGVWFDAWVEGVELGYAGDAGDGKTLIGSGTCNMEN